jgi:hypothetical protein
LYSEGTPKFFNDSPAGQVMDNWRGSVYACLFFGYAVLLALDLPGVPARTWFNHFLDATFGAFHIPMLG